MNAWRDQWQDLISECGHCLVYWIHKHYTGHILLLYKFTWTGLHLVVLCYKFYIVIDWQENMKFIFFVIWLPFLSVTTPNYHNRAKVVCLIYTPKAQGPQAKGWGCIYQANHECIWYNYYVTLSCANCPLRGQVLSNSNIIHQWHFSIYILSIIEFDFGLGT